MSTKRKTKKVHIDACLWEEDPGHLIAVLCGRQFAYTSEQVIHLPQAMPQVIAWDGDEPVMRGERPAPLPERTDLCRNCAQSYAVGIEDWDMTYEGGNNLAAETCRIDRCGEPILFCPHTASDYMEWLTRSENPPA